MPVKPSDIYLYVPNLIGYFRVITAILSYAVAHTQPILSVALYFVSFTADAADGMAARALDQCSSFGAILDMMTDRAATAAYLVILSDVLELGRWGVFGVSCLVGLDVGSHFVRMYASLYCQKTSHKDSAAEAPWLLRLYYSNRKVMGAFCVGQELSYIGAYILHFYPDLTVVAMSMYVLVPLCVLKQICNVLQMLDGFREIAEADAAAKNQKSK